MLYWQLSELGVHCDVVAPTLVPVKSGDRIKTDRRDALKLASSYRSVGVLLARGVAALLDRLSRTGPPDFPFKPVSFFHFSATHVVLGIAVALAAALVGAFFPARAAARLDPAKALTDS